jgi:hypothetical protein
VAQENQPPSPPPVEASPFGGFEQEPVLQRATAETAGPSHSLSRGLTFAMPVVALLMAAVVGASALSGGGDDASDAGSAASEEQLPDSAAPDRVREAPFAFEGSAYAHCVAHAREDVCYVLRDEVGGVKARAAYRNCVRTGVAPLECALDINATYREVPRTRP